MESDGRGCPGSAELGGLLVQTWSRRAAAGPGCLGSGCPRLRDAVRAVDGESTVACELWGWCGAALFVYRPQTGCLHTGRTFFFLVGALEVNVLELVSRGKGKLYERKQCAVLNACVPLAKGMWECPVRPTSVGRMQGGMEGEMEGYRNQHGCRWASRFWGWEGCTQANGVGWAWDGIQCAVK